MNDLNPDTPEYRIFYGRCHSKTVTQLMSVFYILGYTLYYSHFYSELPETSTYIILITFFFLTPFIADDKCEPYFLTPLFMLLIYGLWWPIVYLLNHSWMFFYDSTQFRYEEFVSTFTFACSNAFYFYVSIIYFLYLKERRSILH